MSKLKVVQDPLSALWVLILWEDALWKKVYKPLFMGKLRPLFTAENVQEVEQIFSTLEERVSKSFAVRSLSKRAILSVELLKKLREKGISEVSAQKALAFCQKIGAIQDEDLLEARVTRELNKGHGLRYVQAKWNIDVHSEDHRKAEKEAAVKLLHKKGKKQKDLYLFLQRRGFGVETIREVLRDLL